MLFTLCLLLSHNYYNFTSLIILLCTFCHLLCRDYHLFLEQLFVMGEIVYYIPSHSFLIREQEFEKMPFTWKNPQNINIAFNSVRCYKQPFYLRTLKGDTKESLVNFGFHLLLDFLLVCREILYKQIKFKYSFSSLK